MSHSETVTQRRHAAVPTNGTRAWLAVFAVAVGSFNLVTNEFLPVGLLSDIHRDLNVSEGTAGTMVTAPGLVAAFSAPLLPVLLRRLDRRYALLGLSLLFVLADVLASVAPNFGVMLAARAILGIGIGGFWAIAVGLGTRLISGESAPRATATIFGGISIGTVVGVPAGPLLGEFFGWRGAFLCVAALGLLPLILQFILLPRIKVESVPTLGSLTTLLKSPRARTGLLMTFFTIAAEFVAYTFVAPFLEQYTGASTGLVSTLLLVFAAAGIIGNFATGYFLQRRLRATAIAVTATLVVSVALMPALGSWPIGAFIILAAWGLAYGGVPVAMQTWLFDADQEAASESGSGMFVATFQISIALGSLVGGLVVDFLSIPGAMYLGALLALVALALIISEKTRTQA